jgi:hypothetical protein
VTFTSKDPVARWLMVTLLSEVGGI